MRIAWNLYSNWEVVKLQIGWQLEQCTKPTVADAGVAAGIAIPLPQPSPTAAQTSENSASQEILNELAGTDAVIPHDQTSTNSVPSPDANQSPNPHPFLGIAKVTQSPPPLKALCHNISRDCY